jgi:hypothetical protein
MTPKLERLLCQHAAASWDKQMHLADVIEERSWEFSMEDGLLRFGDDLAFSAQILGSESESAGTWLWAWANRASGIPNPLLQASLKLRQIGQGQGIDELARPEVGLDEVDGHRLSMIASGLLNADAYYRGPYEGGAVFMLIHDKAFRRREGEVAMRLSMLFPELLSNVELSNHRLAFESYLAYLGLKGQAGGDRLGGTLPDGRPFSAAFDSLHRLVELSVERGP